MIQRRLRVVKWLSTTPAVGACTLCSREFKVPMSALKRSALAQSSLQEQFERHRCEPADSSQAPARVAANVLLGGLNEEEDEPEDEGNGKEEDDDHRDTEGGYSE
jgi:hypothetical protein